ncbi:hypothetical protein JHK82_042795 [Glycine max]|nr:hypothetical protein JHK87_042703 [Glycine soja]KAG4949579.1 hypothetical protein JHK86_042818 [Glycine max]KAG4957076.1 hypothetical protein JHK85_043456 [Glycine max]KAG5105825.1 hypothetical protein JHK82_042795 [Glycine max]
MKGVTRLGMKGVTQLGSTIRETCTNKSLVLEQPLRLHLHHLHIENEYGAQSKLQGAAGQNYVN